MKAAVCTAYGPPEVLRVTEVPEPQPRRNEVRIRIHATAVTASDTIVRGLKLGGRYRLVMRVLLGFTAPRQRILGMVLAGEIDAVGDRVTDWKVGDEVFGIGGFHFGAYAEKVCWPAGAAIAQRPANLSFEEAAALPYGGLIATDFLRKLKVRKDQRVLIYGASGAIGTCAVQLAKHAGAEVTGVCSTANLDLVLSLGATSVIDYTKEDFTRGTARYDVIFDAVGMRKSAASMANAAAALAPGGVEMSVDDGGPRMLKSDLIELGRLAEAEELRPVIDRTYTLDEIVEAHRYVDLGHKKGNVIVTVIPTAVR